MTERRYLRPTRVFLLSVAVGVLAGIGLRVLLKPALKLLEEALYFRITKPLEIIEGPLSGIVGGKEAVTAIYLFLNNTVVSLVAAFGGPALVRLTVAGETGAEGGRLTRLLRRMIGEGSSRYAEYSVVLFLLPLAVVAVNGFILGMFSVSHGLSLKQIYVYLAYVLPHGSLELPAVIIAATIGYYHAVHLDSLLENERIAEFVQAASDTVRSKRSWSFFLVVVVMLTSAATVETYVTPTVGRNALQDAYFSARFLNKTVSPGETSLLYITASFGCNIVFHKNSPDGPEILLAVTGSKRFPFEVNGRVIADGEVLNTTTVSVPLNVGVIPLRVRAPDVEAPTTIYAVISARRHTADASFTVTP